MASYNYNGMEISQELLQMIQRGINREGGQSDLARKMGVTRSNICNWTGNAIQKNKWIAWDKWDTVREYLVSHGEIDCKDPKYMTREQLIEMAYVNGDNLTEKERKLLLIYRSITDTAQKMVDEYAELLVMKYKKEKSISENGQENYKNKKAE